MKIMGIDLALNKVGIAFFNTSDPKWDDVFLLSVKKNKSSRTRLIDLEGFDKFIGIASLIRNLILMKSPDVIAMEDFSFGSQGRAVFEIGQLTGIVRLALHSDGYTEKNEKLILVAPTQVKKAATGKGNASKIQVIMAVCKKTGQEYVEQFGAEAEDVCDAVGVVMAYLDMENKVRKGMKLKGHGK